MRVALYARVSTKPRKDNLAPIDERMREQSPENQLLDLRAYSQARGWEVVGEFVDRGISGAKERRPGLDALMSLARSRKIDAMVVVSLDRWGRSVSHLIRSLEDLQALGVAFVALRDGLDLTTPGGKLMFTVIAALAEYERAMIRERTLSGLRRIREQGTRSGKPVGRPFRLFDRTRARELRAEGKTLREIGASLGVPASTVMRALRQNHTAHRGECPSPKTEVPPVA